MSREVKLHLYDLSGGLARQMSMSLLGKYIEGIWHTGVVVDGIEYFYGGGIQRCSAAASPFGAPYRVIPLGETEVPQDMLEEFLNDLQPRYNAATYDLLSNNCNNFSEELSQLLLGTSIPAYITGLPAEVMATPFGQMILPMLQPALQQRLGSATATGFGNAPPQATTSSRPVDVALTSLQHAAPSPTSSSLPASATLPAETVAEATAATATAAMIAQSAAAEADTISHSREAAVKAKFEEHVRSEFAKVLAEGMLDTNAAGVEALRRALVAVRQQC